MSSFADWKDRLFFWTIVSGVVGVFTAIVGWATWATVAIMDRPDVAAMHNAIQMRGPYIEDRQFIRDRLDQAKLSETRLAGVIERNTTAINALSVAMATNK
tara:strand:- start:1360 stop:1662 length:303 start_codon:yes stop_codon:yes gene_type:complete